MNRLQDFATAAPRLAWHALRRMIEHKGLVLAGNMAYAALLALFPFLMVVGSIAAIVGATAAGNPVIDEALRLVPPDVAEALRPAVERALRARSGGALAFGLLAGLWASTVGVNSFRVALNAAAHGHRPSPFWQRLLANIVFVAVGSVAIVATMVFVVVLPAIYAVLPSQFRLLLDTPWLAAPFRFGIGFALVAAVTMAAYRWLPDRVQPIRSTVPGALVAAGLWFLAATGFSFYLRSLAHYSALYGGLAGIIVTLVFFYISAEI